MRGLNRITLVGRLGQEPESRVSKNNYPLTTFSVATNRSRKEGDKWIEETDWHDVKVFGEDAERCTKRLKKGSCVAVDGTLVYETWTDDAGQKRRRPRILANKVEFLMDLKSLFLDPAAADEEQDEDEEHTAVA